MSLPPAPSTWVKTKIVATVGPATESTERLMALAQAGVDVFRLNFAHGTWDWHSRVLERIRQEVCPAINRSIAVLQDLGGPKLRLGEIPGGSMHCHVGDLIRLVKTTSGQPGELTCTYPGLVDDLDLGDSILLADGMVALEVTGKKPGVIEARVTLPGQVGSRQGIASPNAKLQLDPLTEKDLSDLDWSAKHDIDYVGMSFVRRAGDIERLRRELHTRGSAAHIIAKIEKAEALASLDDIIRRTDAVMVARGDLGVELDVARIPIIQKHIISRCRELGKPVITATQMLESMRLSNRPTRAEATDVANAILDGTDAVMLSAETASGEYPVEAAMTMNRIARETERELPDVAPHLKLLAPGEGVLPEVVQATVHAAGVLAWQARAALVLVTTRSGKAALALSKQRCRTPTLGLSNDPAAVRRMALYWGVMPVEYADSVDSLDSVSRLAGWAKEKGLVGPGQRLVYLLGASWSDHGHTAVMVQEVP